MIMFEYIIDFIEPELIVLIPVLYLIGLAIKKSNIKDKWIPVILGVSGVLIACIYVLALEQHTTFGAVLTALFTAITQGILCAGASVYIDQIIKQSKKEE